jgi:hypothetical protein
MRGQMTRQARLLFSVWAISGIFTSLLRYLHRYDITFLHHSSKKKLKKLNINREKARKIGKMVLKTKILNDSRIIKKKSESSLSSKNRQRTWLVGS